MAGKDAPKHIEQKQRDNLYWVVSPGQVPTADTVRATVNAAQSDADMFMSDAIALDKTTNSANFLFYARRAIRRGETLFVERAKGVVPRPRIMEVLMAKGRAVCSPKRTASLPMVAGIIECMKQDVLQVYPLRPTVNGTLQWNLFALLNAKDLFPRSVDSAVVRDLLTERAMFQAMFKAAGIAHRDAELPVSVLQFAKIYCNAFAYISLADAARVRVRSTAEAKASKVKADGDSKEINANANVDASSSKPLDKDQLRVHLNVEAVMQGRCVFPLGSFFNHACEPNTKQFFEYSQAPDVWMAIEALHDIW